ncbi:MAG: hypothetical protein GY903_21185 [Fuerstiella sp.]|nr:hypothetical protein [Fuerstiella sp.]MCP4857005.1 hypothetical protein [Fuerstiella sp.]
MTKESKRACPCCGGSAFRSGILKQAGRTDALEFAADEPEGEMPAWLEGLFKKVGVGGAPVQAQVCEQCGHVSLFVETKQD